MNVIECLYGFQFDEHRLFHQQVNGISADDVTLVGINDPALLRDRQTCLAQFVRQYLIPLSHDCDPPDSRIRQ